MLANTYKRPEPSIYALDRIISVQETNDRFEFPKGFDTELFFQDYYGVLCGSPDKPERIVVRAYPPFTHYLRTLPLHHSQKELQSTPEYADFEFYLRPTFDFLQELFSQVHEVEVLKPDSLRNEMKELLAKTIERYG
jgi:predicted DNA-binding transcriptional regulator YafY